jgi:hypothetical protein
MDEVSCSNMFRVYYMIYQEKKINEQSFIELFIVLRAQERNSSNTGNGLQQS